MEKLLKTISQFGSLEADVLDELTTLFVPTKLRKGGVFCQVGSNPKNLGFVEIGILRAYYTDQNGKEYNKTFFPENSFAISLAAALTETESYLAFDALTDTDLWVADFKAFQKLMQKYRSLETVYRKVIEYEWVVKKEKRELMLVMNSASERYMYFLKEYPTLEQRIPQYHIASHLGITPIQLSRIRAQQRQI